MLLFIGKIALLFFIFVGATRLLGKTALAQLTPHDFGAIFFLVYLLFGSIDVDGLGQGLVGVATVAVLYFTVSKLTLFNRINKYIIGEPIFLIRNGKIMMDNLRRSSFTLAELLSTVRVAGYYDIDDVGYALLEPNGDISVLPKQNDLTSSRSHSSKGRGLPVAVIIDGQVQIQSLNSISKDKQWLDEKLAEQDCDDPSKVVLATVTESDYVLKVFLK